MPMNDDLDWNEANEWHALFMKERARAEKAERELDEVKGWFKADYEAFVRLQRERDGALAALKALREGESNLAKVLRIARGEEPAVVLTKHDPLHHEPHHKMAQAESRERCRACGDDITLRARDSAGRCKYCCAAGRPVVVGSGIAISGALALDTPDPTTHARPLRDVIATTLRNPAVTDDDGEP